MCIRDSRKNAILSMIAQYQKKFNFTAVLVSHEIPDVYFISNRILSLYQHKIVFQGTPAELENFDHPFKEEVINSLEALQMELTGLYSKRQFEMLNHIQLKRNTAADLSPSRALTLSTALSRAAARSSVELPSAQQASEHGTRSPRFSVGAACSFNSATISVF